MTSIKRFLSILPCLALLCATARPALTGIADIGFGPMGVTPGRFPLAEVMEQPLG